MSISTHVLDTATGGAAGGVPILLERLDTDWIEVCRGITNDDGRLPVLTDVDTAPGGTWRITFDTDAYFEANGIRGFYPYASVVFRLDAPEQHYHVPLLLSPFGFSTYRGS